MENNHCGSDPQEKSEKKTQDPGRHTGKFGVNYYVIVLPYGEI